MSNFLQERWELIDKLNRDKSVKRDFIPNKPKISVANFSSNRRCALGCSEFHPLNQCNEFYKQSVNRRIETVNRHKLCHNCLRSNHSASTCKSFYKCRHCQEKHNTMLHISNASLRPAGDTRQHDSNTYNASASATNPNQSTCLHLSSPRFNTLLSTAIVKLQDNQGNLIQCRILLDSGSQSNYITKQLCSQLKLTPSRTNIKVFGINQAATNVCWTLSTTLFSVDESFRVNLSLLVMDTITSNLPLSSFDKSRIPIPKGLKLADEAFNISRPVDVLLGAELFWTILTNKQIILGNNLPTLNETKFGWTVGGIVPTNHANSRSRALVTRTSNLDDILTRFWEIESVEHSDANPSWSDEHHEAERHFIDTTRRDASGRFIVQVPLKSELTLGDSRHIAERQFFSLEKRLYRDSNLKQLYTEFLREYESLGHMHEITNESTTQPTYYLPHHAVLRNDSLTSKIRVVFNASSKTSNGLSLNDIQLVGPTIQRELYCILLSFRIHEFVFSADICKMYRQVSLDESHRPMHRILWRNDPSEPLKCYELSTVTYGTASAPFLATRCIKQLALDNQDTFPSESKILTEDVYVDDVLTGSNDKEAMVAAKTNLTSILMQGGFELRKFLTNMPSCNQATVSQDPFLNITSAESKVLGVTWNAVTDKFTYKLQDFNQSSQNVTKRSIVSKVAQLFDPLGLISPLIVTGKLLIQTLWSSQLTWDEPVNDDISRKWKEFVNDINNIHRISIPRFVLCDDAANLKSIQMHGFADASERAFGACVYLRTIDDNNVTHSHLLSAKSRVAPLKKISLPRLELSAALLLAQLISRVKTIIPDLKSIETYLWSDSTLAWIASPSSRWKTFVSNRVSQIQSLTSECKWRHVQSECNPVDLISRGTTVKNLQGSTLWWLGPTYLCDNDQSWANDPRTESEVDETILEAKTVILTTVTEGDASVDIFSMHSDLDKLLRISTIIFKFVDNTRASIARKNGQTIPTALDPLLRLVAASQKTSFAEDIKQLSLNKPVNVSSRILALSPFLDDKNMLRVGGRLRNAELPLDQMHQLLLDPKHPLTILIVKHEHKRMFHCGSQALLYSLRSRFWPIDGQNLCRKIARNCLACFKVNPHNQTPLMGNLPKHRITPAPPFHTSGIDFAGPILTKDRRGRGCKLIKSYICLFVCFATKAYHIEIVVDLSTVGFIAAFQRFISRRGRPLHLYTDNGTNFVGADADIKRLYEFIKTPEAQTKLNTFFETEKISWHFIPPRAPNFGGLWEAGIKQIKTHLKRIVGNVNLTYEELETVTTQIESVLNSRPLSPLSSSPDDFLPLTPAHFLIGRPLTALPEPDYTTTRQNRLGRYQMTTQIIQHFWKRWQHEYLCQLQQRGKWRVNAPSDLQLGDLVLLREDNLPPLVWKTGRIVELIPGKDTVVRVVNVRLPNQTVIKRAVTKVCPLPKCEN